MKHTVTLTYEVEASSWDLAIEQVLRWPLDGIADAKVKTPGKALVHVAPSNIRQAAAHINQMERDE